MPPPIQVQPGLPALPVPVGPGGSVVLTGFWNLPAANLVIDACQSGPPEGPATGGGAFDLARGWHVRSRDWATHRCELVQSTPAPDPLCALAGTQGSCLVSGLARIAHSLPNPMSVGELVSQLQGSVQAVVLVPPAPVEPVQSPVSAETGRALGAVVLLGCLAVGTGFALRKRAQLQKKTEWRVARVAGVLSGRLRRADPVFARLAPHVEAMIPQARELAALRDRLHARLEQTATKELAAQVRQFEARGTLSSEQQDQLRYLKEQLETTERWQHEAARAQQRLERLLAYLETLALRLDDEVPPGDGGTGVRVETDAEKLAELEQDVQSALEGAREAAALGRKKPTL